MNRAFSDAVIQSSNIVENDSSEEEQDPLQLHGNELEKSLQSVPSLNHLQLNYITVDDKNRDGNFLQRSVNLIHVFKSVSL